MKQKSIEILSKTIGWFKKQEGPGLSNSTISAYNAARKKPSSNFICHAPFSNMYFNVHGDCAPCWLTFLEPDHYPKNSIREIWFGEKFQSIRDNLKKFDLTHKCNVCLKNLQTGNYTSVLARAYDNNEVQQYPTMMELELANTCNLECVMCIGELSSSIRKNRDHLPPLESPYDENFAQQMEEFIPHLKELRFNGGEPFLIPIVYSIFEKVERINPNLKIVIATNGTILNEKVKRWLNKLNIHINFSLDSLTDTIYEDIRVNAKFNKVMENFIYFKEYAKKNQKTMCVMVNPMRNNWHEMPEFIRFVNRHELNIWFNTIHRPVEWAIWSLPANELKKVYESLIHFEFKEDIHQSSLAQYNLNLYKNLVHTQIKNWHVEAQERESNEEIKSKSELEEKEIEIHVKKRLQDFIYTHFNEGEEQKKNRLQLINQKLNKIETLLHQRNGNVAFYEMIFDTPTDVLYTKIESRSAHSLVEDFENFMIQRK